MTSRRSRYAYPCPFKKGDQPARPLPPLFHNTDSLGMVSADQPFTEPEVPGGHEVLGRYMDSQGLRYIPTLGHYGGKPERSYIVLNPSVQQMQDLGRKFGQESVIHSEKGKHKLLFTNGPHVGKYTPGLDSHEFFESPPNTDYTMVPGAGFLRLHFDWDTKHAFDPNDALAQVPAPADPKIVKHEAGKFTEQVHCPHPNAYEWHDGHTDHYRFPLGKEEHPHTGGPPQENPHLTAHPPNSQAAGVGVKSYAEFAKPYGTVQPRVKSNLLHYPYHGKLPDIEKLVAKNGYRTYYAGGKYGQPDLANKNYNSGHLMVYDPTPASGGDFNDEQYTNGWRQIHELSHALTYPEVNSLYGEGRRIGKLGTHRTTREALRAVHWEWLAAHKQRELSQQIGIHVPDETFHRELNTVMHDAVHRAVTGKFTEPSDEGYVPFPHKVPLETALGMVRDHAGKMGLADHNSLVTRKYEGDHIVTMNIEELAKKLRTASKEVRAEVAQALRKEVQAYTDTLTAMRSRELRKTADPAMNEAFALSIGGVCPGCGNPDAPGSCTCLVKSDSTGLFAGSEKNKGEKQPGLFDGAHKGAAVLDKKTPGLFDGSTQKDKDKANDLFDGAHKGAKVLDKKTPGLFEGATQGDQKKKADGLFDDAHKGAKVLGKCCSKEHEVGKCEESPGEKHGHEESSSAEKSAAPFVKKSESPLFRSLEKAQHARNLCDGCGKSHAGPRHKSGVKVVKDELAIAAHDEAKGKTPGDITPKKSPKNGSGGEITKGKSLSKDDVPMAKPPSGAVPGKSPAPVSKPSAGGMATPKAAGAVKPPAMPKPAMPKPAMPKAPGMGMGKDEMNPHLGEQPRLAAIAPPNGNHEAPRLPAIQPSGQISNGQPHLAPTAPSPLQHTAQPARIEAHAVTPHASTAPRLAAVAPPAAASPAPAGNRLTSVMKGDFGMGDNGKVHTTPAAAAGSANIRAAAVAPIKKDPSQIRGRPTGHIAAGKLATPTAPAARPAHPVVKLPGAHLFGAAPAPAPAVPAVAVPGKQ